MTIFCTYFDRNYLTRGLVLYESLARFLAPPRFVVLALDAETVEVLRTLALPGVHVVSLEELESWDPALKGVKDGRSRVEYYFTLTPVLPLFVFDRWPEASRVAYVDADLRFYSDPTPLLNELAGGSVLIVPHGFPPQLEALRRHGIFNVGLVGFERNESGIACLHRWRDQCLDWCYDRVDGNRYADQGYLNDWPDVIPGTIVVDRPGFGLGPWNFMRYAIDISSDPPTIDGDELVFYHFQGVKQLAPRLWDSGLTSYGSMPRALRRRLYGDYLTALDTSKEVVRNAAPGTAISARSARALPFRRIVRSLFGGQLMVRAMGKTW